MQDAPGRLSTEQAILRLRADPQWASLMRDTYLDEDAPAAARRFEASGEFRAVLTLLGETLSGATVLDLGAGTGIASFSLCRAGARRVVALEPDPSAVVGYGALARICGNLPEVIPVSGFGERVPLAGSSVDVVYARQVLHHSRDLPGVLRECARVLRPGGLLLATREHVVDDANQLAAFLASHPVHRLAGGEHAFGLQEYRSAIDGAGLRVVSQLGPWDSVINAFPAVRSDAEIRAHARRYYHARWGVFGRLALAIPGADRRAMRTLDQPLPGRLYSFLCVR